MTNQTPDPDVEPEAYLPEPEYVDDQDNDLDIRTIMARFASIPPRSWEDNLAWASGQITSRDQDWTLFCQKFCRTAVGAGGGFGSAWAQWLGLPSSAKHIGGHPDDAPVGAMLFSKGESVHGHVMIAARSFGNGVKAAISTDAVRPGWPDRVSRSGLLSAWGHEYLGWGTSMNGVPVDVKDAVLPQTEKYAAIASARDRLGNVLDDLRTAKHAAAELKDWKDRDRIQAQIDHLRAQKKKLTELHDVLRHS